MKVVTIIDRRGDVVAHEATCRDLKREMPFSDSFVPPLSMVPEYESAQEVAEDFYSDMVAEGSMTPADCIDGVHFYPCLDDLPNAVVSEG